MGTTLTGLEELKPLLNTEAWKYTRLSPVLDGQWIEAESLKKEELPARSQFPAFDGDKFGEIVILNGRLIESWSTLELEGVTLRAPQAGDMPPSTSLQDSINASYLRDVIVIDIKAGTVFKKPLVISTFSFGGEALTTWSVAAPHVVVNVGERAEVAIVELTGGEGRTLSTPVSTFHVAQSGRLTHARLNLSQDSAVHLASTRISCARSAFCETFQFSLSGRLTRENLHITLNEPGAEATLDGLYLVDGKRHVDHATAVEHLAPHTTSSQLYKGVLNDEARAVFNGRVHIHRPAQQSNAAQLNNTLILSKRAEIDTKPELEIDADDVKASHGATIGQIDPDHVFYLRARAIPEAQAIQMLATGFAQDIAFRIKNEFIRSVCERAVARAIARTGLAQAAASKALT